MEKRKLGTTDIDVSLICLGTMTFGEQNTQDEGFAQMDYAVDRGINFFDTAELYSIPPKAETAGSTETIIGNWFKENKNRDKIILATKVVGRTSNTWFRGEPGRLKKKHILEAVEGSLKRLQTDYIDLYQLHWPDRPMGIFGGLGFTPYEGDEVPLEDTLDVLNDLVVEGKIRHVGLSNETAWGVMTCLKHAETKGLPRVQSVQNAYNLLSRSYEVGLSEVSYREKVGLLAYSPLAQGYLTGKYENGALPDGSRKKLFDRLNRYETPGADEAITKYINLARNAGLDPTHMALAFVNSRPFVTSNIIGATTMEQLKTNIDSIAVTLSEDVLEEIENIHLIHSNPCP